MHGLQHQLPPLAVRRPRLAQVPREQAVLEEPRQCRLHGHVDVAHAQLERRAQRVLQRLGRHEVAEPQPGDQRLGEGAEVEHPPRVVHRVQRLQRPLGEPELAVVVVLDHRAPVPAREVEQRPAPVERQRRAGRELVRRRREHQPGRGRQLVDDQPLAVDPDRHHARAVRREHVARQRVAGLLDRHHVAGRDQHPGDQVEGLLGAVGDQHLVGRRPSPPARGRAGARSPRAAAGGRPGRRRPRGRGRPPAAPRSPAAARCRTGTAGRRGSRPGSRAPAWASTRWSDAARGPSPAAAPGRCRGAAPAPAARRRRRTSRHPPARSGIPPPPAGRRPWPPSSATPRGRRPAPGSAATAPPARAARCAPRRAARGRRRSPGLRARSGRRPGHRARARPQPCMRDRPPGTASVARCSSPTRTGSSSCTCRRPAGPPSTTG